jgi:hypothetical protein
VGLFYGYIDGEEVFFGDGAVWFFDREEGEGE